jgi:hypothetical protein
MMWQKKQDGNCLLNLCVVWKWVLIDFFIEYMEMFFDHHIGRMFLPHWSVQVFNFSWCHLLWSVSYSMEKWILSVIEILFSLCCTWNAFSIISWCISNGCLLSLCIYGVSEVNSMN